MRYVDLTRLQLPDGWLAQAATAKQQIENGAKPDDHGDVWKALKLPMAALLNNKCWYCEASSTRDDNAVDHFRPKGRVKDAQNAHAGYRWLAFNHTNFRYSCTFCNSRRVNVAGGTAGGKADRFPLLDEAQRVYVEGPCEDELPALLDPCDPLDWRLLGCQHENGRPCAASTDEVDKGRAEASIEIYHLHHEPTCTARHGVAVELIQDVDEAKQLYQSMTTVPASQAAFRRKLRRILKIISPAAPFSGEMHFLLRGLRSAEHPWIQEILET